MIKKNKIYRAFLLSNIILLTGCTSTPNRELVEEGATVTPATESSYKLQSIPVPLSKIPAAVYQFRDQTGQYKDKENISSFSTAVTQGATPILMKALQDSNWFTSVEREGLQNLLTERKIIRSSVQSGETSNISTTALKPARILLEGGITGYDTNTRTGGKGAEYFGISASQQYREDHVTVHLRAIDIETGQVLVSVSTSKRLLSMEYRTGLFRYIKYKRLLGLEAGYTTNEPSHICVTDAIEKAVHDLILEGAQREIWKFKDPGAMQSPIMKAYQAEKSELTLAKLAAFRKRKE
jgi:curli production assembly/transport component CsgG